MTLTKPLLAMALAGLPALAGAADYVGTLRPSESSLAPAGVYSFAAIPLQPAGPMGGENGYRLKLGYKYSRYLAFEGEYVDFGRSPADLFASPGNLASAFRSSGFGVDTIATLPVWRFSFYGRMGAYRGDARGIFGHSTSLLADPQFTRNTRWRYGLGMRYDVTKSLGIRAELERYSPLGSPFATEVDAADQFSVGVSWRF